MRLKIMERDGGHRVVAKSEDGEPGRFYHERLDDERGIWVEVEDVTEVPGRAFRVPEQIRPVRTLDELPRGPRRGNSRGKYRPSNSDCRF